MKNIIFALTCTIALTTANSSLAQTLKAVDDTQNAGKVEWLNRSADAGRTSFGTPVTREYLVTNISKENLILLQVRSVCYCVTVEWPQEPIRPGESGTIKATYDAQREGDFYKIITVNTNFDPHHAVPFAFTGKVDKQLEANAGQ